MAQNTEDVGYLSDESDFYGGEETKMRFEKRLRNFSTSKWWTKVLERPTPRLKAARETRRLQTLKPSWNPYEGDRYAWQIGEDVSEFLDKLRPSKVTTDYAPWIRIASPYARRKDWESGDDATAIAEAKHVLHDLAYNLELAVKENNEPIARTKRQNFLRKEALRLIIWAAKQHGCLHGKWLIFPEASDADIVWAAVARSTHSGDLGVAAKIATNDYSGKSPVVCVYTKDFTDEDDVRRVIRKLHELNIVNKAREVYYKPDIFTHIGLYSKNPYNMKSWLYKSQDMLK